MTLFEFLRLGETEEGEWVQALMVADYEDEMDVTALEFKYQLDQIKAGK